MEKALFQYVSGKVVNYKTALAPEQHVATIANYAIIRLVSPCSALFGEVL